MSIKASMLRGAIVVLAATGALLWDTGGAGVQATVFSTATGLNAAITDNGYDGTTGTMLAQPLTVSGLNDRIITSVIVTVGLDHPFVGDLTIKLLPPSGSPMLRLLSRPGALTADNGGDEGAGDSSNLSSRFPIIFDDSAADDAETMGLPILDAQVIGDPSNGTSTTYYPDADPFGLSELLNPPPDLLANLNGQEPNGVWTLYIGDSSAGETGTLDFWSLTLQTERKNGPPGVPEAQTAVLGGLGLLALGVWAAGARANGRQAATQRA